MDLGFQNKDWRNNLSNEEKESVEKGIQDAKKGKLNPHSKAQDLYEKWL